MGRHNGCYRVPVPGTRVPGTGYRVNRVTGNLPYPVHYHTTRFTDLDLESIGQARAGAGCRRRDARLAYCVYEYVININVS